LRVVAVLSSCAGASSQMMLLAVTAIGLVGAVVDHKFNTVDAICFVGVDDKSAANLPSVPHEHTSTLERMIVSLNGQADYIDQTMTAMLVDSTKSMKNTDVVLNEILINLLERLNGEKVIMFLFDCGPLNHNAAVAEVRSSVPRAVAEPVAPRTATGGSP